MAAGGVWERSRDAGRSGAHGREDGEGGRRGGEGGDCREGGRRGGGEGDESLAPTVRVPMDQIL